MNKEIRVLAAALLISLGMPMLAGTACAQEDMARVNFLVVRDYNGKPVRNAAVVIHPVSDKGKQERGGVELKADAEGKTSYDGVPFGKVRIQVLAHGFQTFGEDYDIDQPVEDITVRLKRPQEQYSIYTDHANDKKDEPSQQKPEENKPEPKNDPPQHN